MRLSRRSRLQRGLSIVELMVGVAVGLFIIGGAIKLFMDMFSNNRRLVLETRVNQDLRAAADIIARDVRRAGYWRGAASALTASPPTLNPYAAYGAASTTSGSVQYAYDRDGNSAVDAAERAGFQLAGNQINMIVGGAAQPLTDPATVRITRFEIVNAASGVQWSELWQHCPCVAIASGAAGACPTLSTSASRPQLGARWVDIVIEGQAATASSVSRQVVESVRMRNGQLRGQCP
jgi:prepilin peptidase dependent protein B